LGGIRAVVESGFKAAPDARDVVASIDAVRAFARREPLNPTPVVIPRGRFWTDEIDLFLWYRRHLTLAQITKAL
jgi:hypothetical protein